MSESDPPRITALALPVEVDLSDGDAPLAISVAATGGAPVDYVVLEFDRGVAGPAGLGAFAYLTGDWAAGPVSTTLTIDRRTESGPVAISRVWIWDQTGNSRRYDSGQLAERGYATGFDVVGGMTDTAIPALTGLDLSESVDLSSGTATLRATVAALDDTQVAAVELAFASPLARPDGVVGSLLLRPEGDDTFEAGPVTRHFALAAGNASGEARLAAVRIWDIHGKSAHYTADDLAASGFDTGVEIVGGTPDFEPPELLGIALPAEIDVTAGAASFALGIAATDATGISHVQVDLDRPVAGLAFDYLSFYLAPGAGALWEAGTVSRTFTLADDALPGPVAIREVHLFDTLGNGRIYDTADLIALGLPSAFTVVDGTHAPALTLAASVTEAGVLLSLAYAGGAVAKPLIDLQLSFAAPSAGAPFVEQMPSGVLTLDDTLSGDLRTLDIDAQIGGVLSTGDEILRIALPATGAGDLTFHLARAGIDGSDAGLAPPRDIAFGGGGDDLVVGDTEGDLLFGRAGDDTLSGGAGDDTLTGGTGSDLFVIAPRGGTDVITDFEDGTDLLDLTAFDRSAAIAALSETGGTLARLVLPDGSEATLPGLAQDDLTLADALLATAPREGAVWIAQRVTLGPDPVTVVHGWRFDAPVAIAGAPVAAGPAPAAVRVHAVTETSVTLSLDAPAYLGRPPSQEEVTLLVAEAGVYRLADGTVVQAGSLKTDLLTPQGFARIAHDESFARAPATLTQIQTHADPGFAFTRQAASDETGLSVAMQAAESALFGHRGAETIGWVSVAAGRGIAAAPGSAAARFEAGRTDPAISDGGARHDFSAPFAAAPGVVAKLSSFAGPDPAVLRLPAVDAAGFAARAQEDQSLDLETTHAGEVADYVALALPGGQAAAAGAPLKQIGEVHRISLSDAVYTVTFLRAYDDPVVVAQGAGFAGPDPVTVRLRDLSADGVTLRLQEPDYLDGSHAEEQVTLLVLEAGRHELADGTTIEAGIHGTARLSPQGFDPIRYEMPFTSRPIVLSTVLTEQGPDWVVTRHAGVTATGFELGLQEEEARNGGSHATEEVGWLAITPGAGTWSGMDWASGSVAAVGSSGARHSFPQGFDAAPGIVASLGTFAGADPAAPRVSHVDGTGFTGWAQEEASLDAEVGHLPERLDYIAFASSGALHGFTRAPVIAEAGRVALTEAPVSIPLGHRFDAPLVFAMANTSNGAEPVTVRVEAVTPDRLTLALQEPLARDGVHAVEEVTWLVVEAGSWLLADGTVIEAGAATVEARGGAGLTDVSFEADLGAAPATLAMVQPIAEPDFLDTRQDGATGSGMRITVEAEEARNALPLAPTTVGWLAVEAGTGVWETADGAIAFEATRTAPSVTHAAVARSFAAPFEDPPLLIAQMASYAGPDPAVLRASALDPTGVSLRVQEDRSADTELGHAAESISLIGLGGAGLLLGEPIAG